MSKKPIMYTATDPAKNGDYGCEIQFSHDKAGNMIIHNIKFTVGSP